MAPTGRARSPESDERTTVGACDLARRIRDGDTAAEAALVERYRDGLCTLLRRRVKDAALADDLCHDVLRIALCALRAGKLQDEEKLTGYVWGIARNLASSERRVERRRVRVEPTDAIVDRSPGPDRQLIAAERARLVRRAVERLAPRDRDVLTAFYLSDTSKEQICERLGLSPSQFDLIKWRALRRLQAALRLSGRGDERP